MICHSYSGTIKLLDKLAEHFDIQALYWSDQLLSTLKVVCHAYCCVYIHDFRMQDRIDTAASSTTTGSSSQAAEWTVSNGASLITDGCLRNLGNILYNYDCYC